jgi:P-type Ca2+ transporter type 2C
MATQGLTDKIAKEKLKKFGENKLKAKKKISALKVFLSQFKSPLIYILVAASGVTLALGDLVDAGVIGAAVVLNTILGFYQEIKAERSLEALSSMLTPKAKVIRDSKRQLIEASLVVPGDICVLEIGERVPADGKVIESDSLSINEAMLTGESVAVAKNVKGSELARKVRNLSNRVYMGTMVSGGIGLMKVEKTGQETEIGKIADKLTETQEEKTPLQKQIMSLSKKLAIMVGIISLIILAAGLLAGDPFIEIFTTAVAVAVSAIPEGLAVSLTVILAIGMQRIFKKKSIVRKLMAAETLGSVTVICADKTGTLTEGKMQVVEALTPDSEGSELKREVRNPETLLVKATMLCNDMRDPLEIGMMDWAKGKMKVEMSKLEEEYPRLDEIPFDPRYKYIATLHQREGKNLLLVSGAPEVILKKSDTSDEMRKKWGESFVREGKKGRRLVGFAYKEIKANKISDKDIKGLKWLGSLLYEDPVRKGVEEALRQTKKAGIKVKVITGDYRFTAEAVVNELKLEVGGLKENQIMEGVELARLSDEELEKRMDEVVLFARTKPEQKLRIVKALQDSGEVVAMTGDGVNDAPAIKKADIGIVVEDASAVAKETADMILMDSNFETIVAAIEEGRGIFVNLKKIILYLLSDSFTEVFLVLGSIFIGLPLPITAAQILWINLVDDGLPDFALTLEPKPKDLMSQKPEGHGRSLLDNEVKLLIGLISIVTAGLALGVFSYYLKTTGNLALARSVTFAMLGVDSLLYVFSCKTLKEPIWREKLFDNVWLIGAVLIGLAFQVMALYVPGLQVVLKTVALGVNDWLVILGASAVVMGMIEGVKFVYNKKK